MSLVISQWSIVIGDWSMAARYFYNRHRRY